MDKQGNFSIPCWLKQDSEEPEIFYLLLMADKLDNLPIKQIKTVLSSYKISIDNETLFETKPVLEWSFLSYSMIAWEIFQTLLNELATTNIDIAIVPEKNRTKKLLLCDMDSTIVQSETLDDLAEIAGVGEKVKTITTKAMQGKLDFNQALQERINLLKDQPETLFDEVVNKIKLNSGAERLLNAAKAKSIRTVLISGGFNPVVKRIAKRLGFDRYVCNQLEFKQGKITGNIQPPIINAECKLETLKDECEKLGIQQEDVCSIGDGANDLPMLKAAGLGVAFQAKPIVRKSIPYQFNHTGLDSALYIMGIK